ncbi:uncharacterized protein VTP21DRAFT_7666 [Calcarisporiella thermophila]|uniref:uncharacterized protein n=1 Tax=Calcarisporiella thermophila TaxID=911321 RepID=UPI0037444B66
MLFDSILLMYNTAYGNVAVCLATAMAIQVACYCASVIPRTEKFYDASGSATFLVVILASLLHESWFSYLKTNEILFPEFASFHPRQLLASTMIAVWTLRLGTFLLYRIFKEGKDSRFDELKKNAFMFFIPWSIQALWVIFLSLPVIFVNSAPAHLHPSLNLLDLTGFAIWAFGFIFESVADFQKLSWRHERPEHREKFIQHGLWSVSRHPNYFGEIVLWWGVWILCWNSLAQMTKQHFIPEWAAQSTLISPIFDAFLLLFVSGIPPLEESSNRKFGSLKAYQEYKRRTPILIPKLWKSSN